MAAVSINRLKEEREGMERTIIPPAISQIAGLGALGFPLQPHRARGLKAGIHRHLPRSQREFTFAVWISLPVNYDVSMSPGVVNPSFLTIDRRHATFRRQRASEFEKGERRRQFVQHRSKVGR
jgi:hypothetical protein